MYQTQQLQISYLPLTLYNYLELSPPPTTPDFTLYTPAEILARYWLLHGPCRAQAVPLDLDPNSFILGPNWSSPRGGPFQNSQ